MIKLTRGQKPQELTDELVQELTDEFKQNKKKSVWNKTFITDALFNMSNGKCSYCESKLREESKHLTVDHFHHKDAYPDEVVLWGNLLPACSNCNSQKSTHDTKLHPIIDPTLCNPQEHLYFKNYFYVSYNPDNEDDLGTMTLGVIDLNKSETYYMPRVKIGYAIREKMIAILDLVRNYEENTRDVRKKNRIVRSVSDLLNLASPPEAYSALAATVILEDSVYECIKEALIDKKLWNDEFEQLEESARRICLSRMLLCQSEDEKKHLTPALS